MEEKYCQSCGMPMGTTDELYGTNADQSKSEDYCEYCYKNGEYTADTSMEQMIEFCIPHVATSNPNLSKDDARKMMNEFFPSLKRWQKS